LLARSRIYPSTKTLSLREKVYRETIRIQKEREVKLGLRDETQL